MVACRRSTLALVAELDQKALCRQPHPEFSPIGWHLGHIAYTEALWIVGHCAGLAPSRSEWQTLFRANGVPKRLRTRLPAAQAIFAYLAEVRGSVLRYLEEAPLLTQARLWHFVLQHETMHGETIAMLRRLAGLDEGLEPLSGGQQAGLDDSMVVVPAGPLVMGSDGPQALDNERPAHPLELAAFAIDRYPMTQGRFREFMAAGGYEERRWWSSHGWAWRRRNGVTRPLYWRDGLDDRPVCGVSFHEAQAYCRFAGRRLPTEAEWERASQARMDAEDASLHPWGQAPPTSGLCNFDRRRGWTSPVGGHPRGRSAFDCHDMLGNVWEWTASAFAPHPSFEAFPYEGYSQDYFDGRHRVLKGGSWATGPWVLRRTFRNWYGPGVRELFAGFRCARDVGPPAAARARRQAQRKRSPRLRWAMLEGPREPDSGAGVVQGLSAQPKTLPSKYFYDDRGSALFERICELPEYYLTRTERGLIEAHGQEIARATGPSDLVELGSGSANKTHLLLEAYLAREDRVRYVPIDVSQSILRHGAEALLAALAGLEVRALVGTYEQGLAALDQALGGEADRRPRLVLFLGSTTGNLTPEMTERFLADLRAGLRPGDHFLVGMDLRKDAALIERAYNDSDGVTAEFNLNILRHLNRRFGGDFVLRRFAHQAFYEPQQHQIEMHLRSLEEQIVRLEALDFEFGLAQGETIRTEISRKFDLQDFAVLLEASGFEVARAWTDTEAWFGLILARAG